MFGSIAGECHLPCVYSNTIYDDKIRPRRLSMFCSIATKQSMQRAEP